MASTMTIIYCNEQKSESREFKSRADALNHLYKIALEATKGHYKDYIVCKKSSISKSAFKSNNRYRKYLENIDGSTILNIFFPLHECNFYVSYKKGDNRYHDSETQTTYLLEDEL